MNEPNRKTAMIASVNSSLRLRACVRNARTNAVNTEPPARRRRRAARRVDRRHLRQAPPCVVTITSWLSQADPCEPEGSDGTVLCCAQRLERPLLPVKENLWDQGV